MTTGTTGSTTAGAAITVPRATGVAQLLEQQRLAGAGQHQCRPHRNLDIDRNVERGDIEVNRGIVGNEVTKWEHNPERRGGVRYRDASTENRFAAKRGEATIDRDEARGRMKSTDRQVKAPNLDQVRREGASQRQGRRSRGRVTRPAGGEARAKVQAKAPAVKAKAPAVQAKAKPKVQAAAATKRPVNREVKRPAAAPAKRPAAASKPLAQRPAASRASAPKASAFKAGKPAASRAASNRGGASRAAAGSVAGAARLLGVAEGVDADGDAAVACIQTASLLARRP
jgi:hypothetical protein